VNDPTAAVVAGVVIAFVVGMAGLAVRLVLQRLDLITAELERVRARLHKMENWMAGQITMDRFRESLKK
jgi:hypothetical protein